MPDTPSPDDQFADLFGKLPSPQRGAASADATADASVPAAPAAPTTRRAARGAAAATTPTADAPAAAIPAVPVPAAPAPASSEGAASTAAASAAADAPGPRRTPATIDALFGDDAPHSDAHTGAKRHERDRRKSRIAGWVVFGVVLALLGGVAAGGVYVWNTYEDQIRALMGWEEPKDYEPGLAHGEAVITIVDGDTGASISTTLFEAGVTKTSGAFYDYLIAEAPNATFHPGAYQLQLQMTSEAALAAIDDPASKLENTAQLREGLTVAQTLPRLADATGIPAEEFEAATADPSVYGVEADTLEGWLFPATYTFDPGVTAEDVIRRLVNRTVTSLDKAGVPVDRRQEILTIAAIIEREGRTDDFAKVSRVIQNRLDEGMLLQMDSTAQYGFGQLEDGSVSTSDEAQYDDNPWNTYVHPGLPVGPIANPGDAAIDAAMHPVDGTWLYFVTVNQTTGETIFSDTYEEHLRGVEQFRQWCADNPDSGC